MATSLRKSGYNPIGVTLRLSASERTLILPKGKAMDLSALSKSQLGNVRSRVMDMAIAANPQFLGHRPHGS